MQRRWYVEADEDLNEAFLEASAIIYRLGGALTVVAHRMEHEGQFVPDGATFLWDSFAPANRVEQQADEPDPIPEPVAEAA